MPTVMITGTNRGLGFEFVKQYAADGWRVFAACRHPTSADSLRLLAERSKGLVEVVTMDVTELRSVKQAAAQIGDGAVDVLINSAGIAGKPHQKAGNVDYESWAAVFNVNTMGPLRVTEAFIDHLSRSERKLAVRGALAKPSTPRKASACCFAPLGGELFLNPTCLASLPGSAAYQVRFPKSLVRRQAGPGFLAGMFTGRRQ